MNYWIHMTEAQRKCLGLKCKFMSHQRIDDFIARSMISLRERAQRTKRKVSGPNFEDIDIKISMLAQMQ